MTDCQLCAHVAIDGSWGTSEHHCGECHRTWTGTAQAHCVTCHRHFTANSTAAQHRVGDGETCRDPETVTTKTGARRLFPYDTKYGVMWGGPPRQMPQESLTMDSVTAP